MMLIIEKRYKNTVLLIFTVIIVLLFYLIMLKKKETIEKRGLESHEITNKEQFFDPSLQAFLEINETCEITNGDTIIPILKFKNTIILYLPSNGCLTCILDEVLFIRDIQNKLKDNELIILTNFKSNKELKMFDKSLDVKFNVYRTTDYLFGRNLKLPEIPFIFWFNEKLEVEIFLFFDDDSRYQIIDSLILY